MLAAERKCGPAPMKGKKWYSPQLKEAAKQLCIAKCWVRKCFTMEAKKGELEEAQKSREEAMINLRKVQKNARQYRDEILDKLAEKRAKRWNMTAQTAAKMLKEAEKNSAMYGKIGRTIKKHKRWRAINLDSYINESDHGN